MSLHSPLGAKVRHRGVIRDRMEAVPLRHRRLAACLAAALVLAASIACSSGGNAQSRTVIRIIGSDTMVNLLQAWAEQ